MFETHPDSLQYFPQFEGLNSPEEQKKSEVFQDHSEKVNNRIMPGGRTGSRTRENTDRNQTGFTRLFVLLQF